MKRVKPYVYIPHGHGSDNVVAPWVLVRSCFGCCCFGLCLVPLGVFIWLVVLFA